MTLGNAHAGRIFLLGSAGLAAGPFRGTLTVRPNDLLSFTLETKPCA